MSYRDQYDDEEADPSPWEHKALSFGTLLSMTFGNGQVFVPPAGSNIQVSFGRGQGKAVLGSVVDEAQSMHWGPSKSDFTLFPPPLNTPDPEPAPKYMTRPPHSMTPPRNSVFDKRGRKRY